MICEVNVAPLNPLTQSMRKAIFLGEFAMNDDGYVFVMIVTRKRFLLSSLKTIMEWMWNNKGEKRQTHTRTRSAEKVTVIAQVEERTRTCSNGVFLLFRWFCFLSRSAMNHFLFVSSSNRKICLNDKTSRFVNQLRCSRACCLFDDVNPRHYLEFIQRDSRYRTSSSFVDEKWRYCSINEYDP